MYHWNKNTDDKSVKHDVFPFIRGLHDEIEHKSDFTELHYACVLALYFRLKCVCVRVCA